MGLEVEETRAALIHRSNVDLLLPLLLFNPMRHALPASPHVYGAVAAGIPCRGVTAGGAATTVDRNPLFIYTTESWRTLPVHCWIW